MYPDRAIPRPTNVFVPRWHSDRFFRGSYSSVGVGTDDAVFNGMRRLEGWKIAIIPFRIG
jgi:hypothetical protein